MTKTLILVEGEHDRSLISQIYPQVLCLTTNGSAINIDINLLYKYQDLGYKIILFFDPDVPGNKIRRYFEERLTNYYNAYLPKSLCQSRNLKKVGVEHAPIKTIKEALDGLLLYTPNRNHFTFAFLYEQGLAGTNGSLNKRSYLQAKLCLPPSNSKTFLKYLNSIEITENQLLEILDGYSC